MTLSFFVQFEILHHRTFLYFKNAGITCIYFEETTVYRVLSEQKQFRAKQFESPVLKGILKAGRVFV